MNNEQSWRAAIVTAPKYVWNWIGLFFAGRIARTTFALQALMVGICTYLLFLPITTFLWTADKTLSDAYIFGFFVTFAVLVVAFIRAYVRRLHDMSLHGLWALMPLIGLPIAILTIGSSYLSHRYALDHFDSPSEVMSIAGWAALILPVLIAFWPGSPAPNKFGSPPAPIDHLFASKLNLGIVLACITMLTSTTIFAGIFQSGVWVGRTGNAPTLPAIQSAGDGHVFIKCWNVKGVGAGTGDGQLKGIYRDGYDDVVFDFIVNSDGGLDIRTAGKTAGYSYRKDGFQIFASGLDLPDPPISYFSAREADRFIVTAIHHTDRAGSPDTIASFAFSRIEGFPTHQMVMTTTSVTAHDNDALKMFPGARGKLMIGDCM